VLQLKINTLTEKVDVGFKDLQDRFKRTDQDVKDGFKRIDRWMMLLIGAVSSLLKSYFHSDWVHSRKPKFKIPNILLDVGSTSQP
jgi:hypothetical protein